MHVTGTLVRIPLTRRHKNWFPIEFYGIHGFGISLLLPIHGANKTEGASVPTHSEIPVRCVDGVSYAARLRLFCWLTQQVAPMLERRHEDTYWHRYSARSKAKGCVEWRRLLGKFVRDSNLLKQRFLVVPMLWIWSFFSESAYNWMCVRARVHERTRVCVLVLGCVCV